MQARFFPAAAQFPDVEPAEIMTNIENADVFSQQFLRLDLRSVNKARAKDFALEHAFKAIDLSEKLGIFSLKMDAQICLMKTLERIGESDNAIEIAKRLLAFDADMNSSQRQAIDEIAQHHFSPFKK